MMRVLFSLAFSALVLASAQGADTEKPKKKMATAEMFKKIDTDADGKVTAEEFKNLTTALPKLPKAFNADEAFKKLDTEKKGAITAEQFAKLPEILKPAGKKKDAGVNPEVVFKQIDADSNGKVTAEEFKGLATAVPNLPKNVNLDEVFKKLDVDGKGEITAEQFAKVKEMMAAKKKKAK